MRAPVPIPLTLGESVRSVSSESLTNAYAEAVTSAKGTVIIRSHPGLTERMASIGTFRGAIAIDNTLYAVLGGSLYSISSTFVAANLGAIPGGDFVMMDGDLTQLIVLNEAGDSYRWDGSNLVQIIDDGYQPASSVMQLDGTTIWTARDTQEFFWSSISDATMISGLDIASAEFKPDRLVRAFPYRTDIEMFGTVSLEAWFDAGSIDTAYERRGDVLLDTGLAGRFAVDAMADNLFWLGHDGAPRMLITAEAARFSTEAVERRINGDAPRGTVGWDDLSRTRTFSYVWRGHLFVTFRHPDGCVQYDLTTKLWSARKSYTSPTWRVVDCVFAFGRYLLFGEDGAIYDLDETTRYEAGDIVEWIATVPSIYQAGQRFILDRVAFGFDMGRSVDPNLTPKAKIYSSDDGYEFVECDEIELGRSGDNTLLAELTQQGQSRDRTYRLVITDDVPVTLSNIFADIRPCRG